MQGDYVSVTIRDTGIGIRVEDRERLFRPFQQLEDGLARQREGTGLGLSIFASLVELMDVPIVAVTSYAMTGDCERAMAAGCTGYLEKPIDPGSFVEEVTAYL